MGVILKEGRKMKTISRIFGTVAAIAALTACNKEIVPVESVVPDRMHKITLDISAKPDTKVVMDADGAGNLYWYGEESIAVIFDGSTTAYKFDATASEKSTSATFTGEVAQGLTKDDIIAVYYPYIDNQATSYSASVPTTQVNSGAINTTTGCYSIKFPLHWVKSGSDSDIKLTAPENSAVLFVDKKYVKPVEEGGENVVKVHVEANSDYEADYTIVMNGADEDLIFAINVPEGGAKLPAVLVNFREDLYFGEELSTKEFKTIKSGKRYKLCEPDYLTFRALENVASCSIDAYDQLQCRTFTFENGTSAWGNEFYATINKNERMQYRARTDVEVSGLGYQRFSIASPTSASGSVMSLINTTMGDEAFTYLFNVCEGLKIAPKLPATELSYYCYGWMFNGCVSLSVSPELPASVLAEGCYSSMFMDCSSLVEVQPIHATTMAPDSCVEMFENCVSLVKAPQLNFTTLANNCCCAMFLWCESLEMDPVLPADILHAECYYDMFKGCAKINNVTMLATDISADYCLYGWLSETAATGTIYVKNTTVKTAMEATEGVIPEGWTVEVIQ